MTYSIHQNGNKLLEQLKSLFSDLNNYSETIDKHIITSTTDVNGKITQVSRAFCEVSGYSEEELLGQSHNIIHHPDMPKNLYKDLWSTIKSGKSWQGEIKNLKKCGGYYWVKLNIDAIKNSKGDITGFVAIREDITDKKRIEKLTVTDELTGAYNRRYYNQYLTPEIKRARRDKQFLVFLMADLDHFKKYNDTYGHQAGDEVLKTTVATMQNIFQRAGDYVFRLGGEEFAVIYRAKTPAQAIDVAEKLRQAIFNLNTKHTGNIPYNRVTVSMGLMLLDPNEYYAEDEIYKYADQSLYKAKNNGRNCIKVHETDNDIEYFT